MNLWYLEAELLTKYLPIQKPTYIVFTNNQAIFKTENIFIYFIYLFIYYNLNYNTHYNDRGTSIYS